MGESKVYQLHSDLSDSVTQFLNLRRQRNKNTYLNYAADVNHFFKTVFGKEYTYVTVKDFNSNKTSLDGLISYFYELGEEKNILGERVYANNTINRKQSSIKELLRFLKVKKIYNQDLTELDFAIKNLPKNTKHIENLQFARAIQYAEWLRDNEKHKANEKYLIAKLAIDTGLRAVELLELKWNQFTEHNDFVFMQGIGKGNKRWTEKIGYNLYNELLELKSDSSKIFTLKYNDIDRMMNRAKKALGDSDRAISFHSFKKCAVTNTYKLTGDILEAKRKGRHGSTDTTEIYIEAEEYGITGFVSLSEGIDKEAYKKVSHDELLATIETMNSDFLAILNSKLIDNKIK